MIRSITGRIETNMFAPYKSVNGIVDSIRDNAFKFMNRFHHEFYILDRSPIGWLQLNSFWTDGRWINRDWIEGFYEYLGGLRHHSWF